MHPLSVGLYHYVDNTIDVPHGERHVGLLLDEAVNLFSKLLRGIFLHVQFLENDAPVVFLEFFLVLLMRDHFLITAVASCHGSEFDGDVVITLSIGIFGGLIDFVGCCQCLVEEFHCRHISVYKVTHDVVLHDSFPLIHICDVLIHL